jgi:hypothetical protein
VGLDAALLACDGEENLRDAVTDIVLTIYLMKSIVSQMPMTG